MKNTNDCLAAAFTLLVLKGVVTGEEVTKATKSGSYDAVWDLLNEKYKEIKQE